MVLDGGDEVYVWVGQGSTDEEKAKSMDMAKVKELYSEYLTVSFTDHLIYRIIFVLIQLNVLKIQPPLSQFLKVRLNLKFPKRFQ